MAAAQEKVFKQTRGAILQWAQKQWGDTGDPENPTTVPLIKWLDNIYGQNPAAVKQLMTAVRTRLELLNPQWAYQRQPPATHVPQLDPQTPGESIRLRLPPWAMSFKKNGCRKGESKNAYILERMQDFFLQGFGHSGIPHCRGF